MRTSNDYLASVKKHVEHVMLQSEYVPLLTPSPAVLKEYCIGICKRESLSTRDRDILKVFVKINVNSAEQILLELNRIDIDKFKPVQHFLTGKTTSPKNMNVVDMVALFYNFEERPLNNFIGNTVSATSISNVEQINEESSVNNEKLSFVETEIDKQSSRGNQKGYLGSLKKKLLTSVTGIAIAAGGYGVVNASLFEKSELCMVWKEREYLPCDCKEALSDYEQGSGNLPITYDKSLLEVFKRVEVDCETTFYRNNKPAIWFLKVGNNKHEYFTHPGEGVHPVSDKSLKPMSEYHLNKYIYPNCP